MREKRAWTKGDTIKLIAMILLIGVIIGEAAYLIRSNLTEVQPDPNFDISGAGAAVATEENTDAPGVDQAIQTAKPAELSMNGSAPAENTSRTIIVLDPGHGKSSSLMSAEEKAKYGWKQNAAGAWGEWRHYKSGSGDVDCEGTGCNHRVTPNGACWYPIGNGDRATEPEINLNHARAARSYLEGMGYTVRMTRTTNDENPSMTKRLSYCYPDNNSSNAPDAALFLCNIQTQAVCAALHT